MRPSEGTERPWLRPVALSLDERSLDPAQAETTVSSSTLGVSPYNVLIFHINLP